MVKHNYEEMTITSLDEIICFDPTTGDYQFTLDELQNATIANSQEEEDITGAGGRLLNRLKKNKAAVVSGANGVIVGGLLAQQVGDEFEDKESTPIRHVEFLTINSDTATTTFKAVGTAGAEIQGVYVKNDKTGEMTEKLEQGEVASAGKFTYEPTSKGLTFESEKYTDGTMVMVVYDRNVKGGVVTNYSTKYSKKSRMYINGQAEDKCGKTHKIQFYIPLVDFSGTFDIAMGDSQTVHNFEGQSLATSSSCAGGTGLASGQLWTYTVFDVDAQDAA